MSETENTGEIQGLHQKIQQVIEEVGKIVVGQQYMVNRLLVGLFTNGHILLEGVPGLAKTLTVNTLARVLQAGFRRIQFTPDLLPADLIGTMIYNQKTGIFEVKKGPVFSNLILADEINRATPRTQSALLEVMEERQVTIDGISRPVPNPFFVVATQNPVEYQGTFPLPEAQMDRFALSLSLGYPSETEELQMLQQLQGQMTPMELKPCISLDEVIALRKQCAQVKVEQSLQQYILRIIRATRTDEDVTLGASPRGSVALYRAIQAHAFLENRDYALPDDVKHLASHVLSHRIIPAGGRQGRTVVQRLMETIAIP